MTAIHTRHYGAEGSTSTATPRACSGPSTGVAANNWRGPTGVNVPAYIAAPVCGRFYVNAAKSLDYGTLTTSPAWMYRLEGNRDVPGFDAAHLGGDVWVTDAAFEYMDHENWSGLMLT